MGSPTLLTAFASLCFTSILPDNQTRCMEIFKIMKAPLFVFDLQ